MLCCCSVASESFAASWAVARQAPLSTGFPRQASWNGLPCRPSGDVASQGWNPRLSRLRRTLYCRATREALSLVYSSPRSSVRLNVLNHHSGLCLLFGWRQIRSPQNPGLPWIKSPESFAVLSCWRLFLSFSELFLSFRLLWVKGDRDRCWPNSGD